MRSVHRLRQFQALGVLAVAAAGCRFDSAARMGTVEAAHRDRRHSAVNLDDSCEASIVRTDGEALIAGGLHRRIQTRVNEFTANDQTSVGIAYEPIAGSTLAVWCSRRQEDGTSGVFGRWVGENGQPLGAEFHVNQRTAFEQLGPVAAPDGRGGAWVAWRSCGPGGMALLVRRFGVNGAATDERVVAESRGGDLDGPVIAARSDGGLLVIWCARIDPSGDGAGSEGVVRGVVVSEGMYVSEPFEIHASRGHVLRHPAVAAAAGDETWVAWQETDIGGGARIMAAQISRDAGRIGPCIAVSAESVVMDVEPSICLLPVQGGNDDAFERPRDASEGARGFMAVWHRYSDETDYDVVVRSFDAAGNPIGSERVVNTTRAGRQNGACLAPRGDGTMFVAWNCDATGQTRIRGRLLSESGRPAGDEVLLTGSDSAIADGLRDGAGPRSLAAGAAGRRIDIGDSGALFVAWSGNAGLGDTSGAHVMILRPDGADEMAGQGSGGTAQAAAARPNAPWIDEGDLYAPGQQQTASPHEPPAYEVDAPVIPPGESGEPGSGPEGGLPEFMGHTFSGWTPPDPEIAVGPNHVVAIVNGRIRFFTKAGVQTFSQSINDAGGFWGAQGATNFVFDPEATYDEASGRFFAMACERNPSNGTGQSYFNLAVSDDDDPNGTWFKYRFNVTALAGTGDIDSPNMAVDGQTVYLTADFFSGGSRHFVYILNKADLLAGLNPAATHLTVGGLYALGVPRLLGAPPAAYMMKEIGGNTIRLYAIQNPLAAPSLVVFDLAVPAYDPATESPPQMGGTTRPFTFGPRFWSAEWRDGSLWAVHHQGGSRILARWYEITTNGWPTSGGSPSLAQSGTIDPGSPLRTYFPAIGTDACGNAMVVYARSSSSEFISMWASWRHRDDPPGAMRGPELIKPSTTYYDRDRWGDYGGIEADPVDGERLWLFHEYAASTTQWTTWVAPRRARPRGDMDGDDAVGLPDVPGFVAVLLKADTDPYRVCTADMNGDGLANGLDMQVFVDRLLSP